MAPLVLLLIISCDLDDWFRRSLNLTFLKRHIVGISLVNQSTRATQSAPRHLSWHNDFIQILALPSSRRVRRDGLEFFFNLVNCVFSHMPRLSQPCKLSLCHAFALFDLSFAIAIDAQDLLLFLLTFRFGTFSL